MALTPTTTSIHSYESLSNITFNSLNSALKPPIITDRTMFYLNIYVHYLLCGSLSVFGVIANIVNMVIFRKIGVKDSMGVGLMALSLSDFLVSFFTLLRMIYFVWNQYKGPDSNVDPTALSRVTAAWWRDVFFLSSCWITTFLSIERCVCVVFPFKVKAIFTKNRSIAIVVFIFIVNTAVHMPIFLSQWLVWKTVYEEVDNATVSKKLLTIQFSSLRSKVQLYIDIANGTVLPIPSQIIVLISVFWLIYGLKVSAKVRNPNLTSNKEEVAKDSYLSSKERKLVNVVLFLAVTLTVCNVPRFIAVYAKQLFPGVVFYGSYKNVYHFLWNLSIAFVTINSSVNIFIYLLVNVSFRLKFKELLFIAGEN